jgi:hemolysin activation/secretion protein
MKRPARPLAVSCALSCALLLAPVAAQEASDTGPAFPVRRFAIEGNTLVATDVLQSRLAPLTGEERRLSNCSRHARSSRPRTARRAGRWSPSACPGNSAPTA